MRFAIVLLAAALLPAAEQNGTVGLSAAPIYSDTSPDKCGPAIVLYVLEETPTANAGIQSGDVITGINGTDMESKSASETLQSNLTGPVGGSVKLTLWRASEGRQFNADLTRVPYPLRRNARDPFQFYSPANWRPEVDAFPLPWSPHMAYHGWEDLVFAPAFEDRTSPNYHSYAFVWWLEGRQEISAARLQGDLLTYYKGISEERGQTRKFTPDLNRVSVKWTMESDKPEVRSVRGDAVFYNPAGELLTLHGEASMQFCAAANHTAGVFILLPQAQDGAIWKDLHAIRDSFHCNR